MAGEGPRGGRGLLKPLGRVGAAGAGRGERGQGTVTSGGPAGAQMPSGSKSPNLA